MIARDAPAQVNDRGRRRDGGLSFIDRLHIAARVVKRGTGKPDLTLAITSGLDPQASRRRPRCVGSFLSTLSTASRSNSAAPFFLHARATWHAHEEPSAASGGERRSGAKRTVRAEPIELYYWPTPNGWKISIMLEECGLPYVVVRSTSPRASSLRREFLAISPNNRMPAIVDPDGPGGRPISVFESGAILQYLGRKTGKFYPRDERARVAVDEWLFWQMGGLGPMAGQAIHFRRYAPEPIALCGRALHRRGQSPLRRHEQAACRPRILAGRYSIADIACVGWVRLAERQGQDLAQFPHLKRWFETIRARPAVKRAFAIRIEAASAVDVHDPKVRAVLFGQRARSDVSWRKRWRGRPISSPASRSATLQITAQHAAFKLGGIGAGHGERTAIGLAVLGVVDIAVPHLARRRLHGEHDLDPEQRPVLLARIGIVLVGLRPAGCRIVRHFEPHQRAAKRAAAIGDADLALLVRVYHVPKRSAARAGAIAGERAQPQFESNSALPIRRVLIATSDLCWTQAERIVEPRRPCIVPGSRACQPAAGAALLNAGVAANAPIAARAVQIRFIALLKPPFKSSDDYRRVGWGK